jgi:hypothetical protein
MLKELIGHNIPEFSFKSWHDSKYQQINLADSISKSIKLKQ